MNGGSENLETTVPVVSEGGNGAPLADYGYQAQRAAILSAAVGRARLHLRNGNHISAGLVLDEACLKTRALLRRSLPSAVVAMLPEEDDGRPTSTTSSCAAPEIEALSVPGVVGGKP